MVNNPSLDQVLAFSGMFQAATLVHQLATHPIYDKAALHEASYSLLRMNAVSAEEVFGYTDDQRQRQIQNSLHLGLECVAHLFGGKRKLVSQEITQYVIGMYHVHAKLRKEKTIQSVIENGLTTLSGRYLENYRCLDHDQELHTDIGTLYEESISMITPRILIYGTRGRLQNPLTVNRIRTALFAGIRATWLWHQLGGRRLQFFFRRKGYRQHSQRLIKQIADTSSSDD